MVIYLSPIPSVSKVSSRKRSKTPQIHVRNREIPVKGLVKIKLIAIRRTVAGASLRNSCAELREATMGVGGRV